MPRKKKTVMKDLVLPEFTRYFFLIAIITVLLLFTWVISPFFNILVYASLIAVVFHPAYKWILKKLRGYEGISAFFATSLVLLILLAPLTLFTIFLAQEAVDAYQVFEVKISEFNFNSVDFQKLNELPWVGEFLQTQSEKYGFQEFLDTVEIDVFSIVQDVGEAVSTFIVSQTGNIVFSLGTTVMNFFILLLTLFFFFRDGDKVVDFIKEISPLPKNHENEIEEKLKETIHGIVIGNFGTSLLQGVVGGIGFAIAGVDHVIFWTTVMVFTSLIPYVGASIIWAPVALALILHGDASAFGWFLGIWGVFAVSSVDNFARPILIGGSAKMHPLSTFLVVLGGILIFGIKGIIFGPLILSLTITIIHIYQLEYKDVLG
ncbi:AI-2E family transporter [Candidatus Peregrinibacteria bacterium]|nr:AI-2E family transporter [Candidatus Peregrinibacteria bacterium]